MIPKKEFYSVSDNAHFLAGATAVLLAVDRFPNYLWWAVGGVAAVSGLKEWLWDPHFESQDVAGSGWRDWAGYLLGLGVALFVHFV